MRQNMINVSDIEQALADDITLPTGEILAVSAWKDVRPVVYVGFNVYMTCRLSPGETGRSHHQLGRRPDDFVHKGLLFRIENWTVRQNSAERVDVILEAEIEPCHGT